jgi:HPt (histidine-containing phosphotransfer) domain-containing protein
MVLYWRANGGGGMLEKLRASGPSEADSNWNFSIGDDGDCPLDLVHLARQCGGDQELEQELLGLFRLQSRALTAQLTEPSSAFLESKANFESKAKIAHKLCGSALAVGAQRVAGAARRIEACASAVHAGASASAKDRAALRRAIAALEAAVAEAIAEIERIRG